MAIKEAMMKAKKKLEILAANGELDETAKNGTNKKLLLLIGESILENNDLLKWLVTAVTIGGTIVIGLLVALLTNGHGG